jgi:hypothetical protein
VIVFGTAVTDAETYDRCAAPGIRRVSEPDSVVYKHHTAGSLFRNYNMLLDKAAEHDDLEALVLIHQDAELVDPEFPDRVREALSDPDVAIVGCAGAVGVRSIAWWQGAVSWAGLTHRYPEFGGGDFPAISWRRSTVPSYASPGEVDSIDGFVIVMSPWAVRELRFDESLGKLHGYDFDICMQAKAAGKKVVTADFRTIHHHSLELIKDPESWIQTYIRLTEKWEHLLGDTGADPRQRALRAEAEAACARAIMVSHQMREQAIKRELQRVEMELDGTKAELATARRELTAAVPKPDPDQAAVTQAPGATRHPAIDYAVEELGIESFGSLEIGPSCGHMAFYTIAKPSVRKGALVDATPGRSGDSLLTVLDLASEHPGMDVLDGSVSDPATVDTIGQVDAILVCDLLFRMVDPDWDQLLEMYAPAASAFVIFNPQWERDETVRLIDLGREEYLKVVAPWPGTRGLFERLDTWCSWQGCRYRDGRDVFQWGITDADLTNKMAELGFGVEREFKRGPMRNTEGFVNKAFVFRRS